MKLWIDLETTGLKPFEGDQILEVGWFIADGLEMQTSPQSRLVTPTRATWDLINNDPFITTMHTNNGLLEDLSTKDTLMIEDIEDLILFDLELLEVDKPILAGSSVHFDRDFIRTWMPRLDKKLSHRHFDVSVLKMFFASQGYESVGEKEHDTAHRAISDIKDSFYLYNRYATVLSELTIGVH